MVQYLSEIIQDALKEDRLDILTPIIETYDKKYKGRIGRRYRDYLADIEKDYYLKVYMRKYGC